MILKDIVAISGQQGLFKFIAQGKNSMIVEHIETGKRSSAFSSARVSSLEEISIFTESEDLPLEKVFDRIFAKENGGEAIDPKSDPEQLRKYFEAIVPDYSKEKVYISDIRKVVLWYNILQRKNLLIPKESEKDAEPDSVEPETEKEADSGTNAGMKRKKEAEI
jgi:hypothetical protein